MQQRRFLVRLSAIAAIGLAAPLGAQFDTKPVPPNPAFANIGGAPALMIGPVNGLTEGWHIAPKGTAIPVGTLLEVGVHAPASMEVLWTGAIEIERTGTMSRAICPLVQVGQEVVRVSVRDGGTQVLDTQMQLDVVNVRAEDIHVTGVDVTTGVFTIDESLPQNELNAATMAGYFGPSIAPLRGDGFGGYVTSVNRQIPARATIEPIGFAPLIEWRVNGVPQRLGSTVTMPIQTIGSHVVAMGPPGRTREFTVQTYDVRITSHVEGDRLPHGIPIRFSAETDPPGHEHEIVWLASTKFGSAQPVLGQGRTFVTQFDNTIGEEDGGSREWKGVKASSSAVGQDQKVSGISPLSGGPGTIINIAGSGFGTNQLGWCVVLKQGDRLTALEVLSVQDNRIQARVDYVPPDADGVPQAVMLREGDGQLTTIIPDFPDVVVEPDQWIWNFDEDLGDPPALAAAEPFTPIFEPPPSGSSYHSGPPTAAGTLCLIIGDDWGQGVKVNLYCRVHQQGTGADTNFHEICFTLAGSRFDCAVRLCNIIVQQLASHPTRPLFVNCTVTVQGGNAKITISLPAGATIDQGTIDVVVK